MSVLYIRDGTGTFVPVKTINGITPHIGGNGNWFFEDTDTGVHAEGTTFTVLGLYATLDALKAAHPAGSRGDSYAVGTETSNVIYLWDVDASAWVNIGALKGPAGKDGATGATGATGADGKDGEDGYTPQRGVDYFTEADKAQMVADVLAALPNASGVNF